MAISPDFTKITKDNLAKRVNYLCSNPACQRPTAGPHNDPEKSHVSGEAAHISGAKPKAARYISSMKNDERKHINNGIWLCKICHGKVDHDWFSYKPEVLIEWKNKAEGHAETNQLYGTEKEPSKTKFLELPSLWNHETTNDDRYVVRQKHLRLLNAQYNDASIRTISITGMGGSGKTSLVGNWLKENTSDLQRPVRGLFYWSFYANRSVNELLNSLLIFMSELDFTNFEYSETDNPLKAFEKVAHELPPILLVLDGLEVLQHALSEEKGYGNLIETKLREFLQTVVYLQEKWLIILTSRFPVKDLRGKQCKQILLDKLEDEESEQVLYRNGVSGSREDRNFIANFLEGHPLTLRLFAASIPYSQKRQPKKYLSEIFGNEVYSDFHSKLLRLMDFYHESLSDYQKALIYSLSIFRSPVPVETTSRLTNKIYTELNNQDFDLSLLEAQLSIVRTTGIILRDIVENRRYYSCHPVIRDFFRNKFFSNGKDVSLKTINLLTDRPDEALIQGHKSYEMIILSIESLVEINEFSRALELFGTRLNKGKVFLEKGLAREGKRMFDAFIRQKNSNKIKVIVRDDFFRVSKIIEHDHLSFLVGSAEFDIELGEYDDAEATLEEALKLAPSSRKVDIRRNLARIKLNQGDFQEAEKIAQLALKYTTNTGGSSTYRIAFLLYYLIRSQAITKPKEAKKRLQELQSIRGDLDSADVAILIPLSEMCIKINSLGDGQYRELIKHALSYINDLASQYFKLEAKLIISHCLTLSGKPDKALVHLQEVNELASVSDFPAKFCQSIILMEYTKLVAEGEANINRLTSAMDIASGGGMESINAEALWIASQIYEEPNQVEDYQALSEENADLIGYLTMKNAFPKV